MTFVDEWRRRKSAAFDLDGNSTARRVVEFDLWGRPVRVYANANLSVYSAQACNAHDFEEGDHRGEPCRSPRFASRPDRHARRVAV